MKLTTFTDYALRTLIYLATRPERRATIAEVAAAFEISEHHLTKVVHFLGKCGWLANVRGKGGGLALAVDADTIGIGDVVRQTEGQALPAECFGVDGGHCSIAPVCRLHGVLGEAVQAFYAVLDRHTLADIARNQRALAGILFAAAPDPARPARRAR
jgi:Rrf2 family nitric oxide-sensitive transcriptional repressor